MSLSKKLAKFEFSSSHGLGSDDDPIEIAKDKMADAVNALDDAFEALEAATSWEDEKTGSQARMKRQISQLTPIYKAVGSIQNALEKELMKLQRVR